MRSSCGRISVDGGTAIGVFRAEGPWSGGRFPGARSGKSHHLQGNCSGTLAPPRAGISPLHAAESLDCAGSGVKGICRTRGPATLVRGRSSRKRWTPEQISGWLNPGTNRGCGRWAARQSTPSSMGTQRSSRLSGDILTSRRHKRRRPRRARASRDTIKDRASIHHTSEEAIESHGRSSQAVQKRSLHHLQMHTACARLASRNVKSRVTLAARLARRRPRQTVCGDAGSLRPHRSSSAKIDHFLPKQ